MNALKYAKILENAGFSRKQAEKTIEVLHEVIQSNFATKEDIKDLRHELQQMKSELIIKLGAMLVAAVAAITALDKII